MRWLCMMVVACLCLLAEGWLSNSRHKHLHNHTGVGSRSRLSSTPAWRMAVKDYDNDSEEDEGRSGGIGEKVKKGFGFLIGTLGKMMKGINNDDEDNGDEKDYAGDGEDDEDYTGGEDNEDYADVEDNEDYAGGEDDEGTEDNGAGGDRGIMGSVVKKVFSSLRKMIDRGNGGKGGGFLFG